MLLVMRALLLFMKLSMMPAREVLRSPVALLIMLTTVMLTLMVPLSVSHQLGDAAARFACDSGLAFQLMAGIALAAYGACALSSRERANGNAALILVKPISPFHLFLSRFGGMVAVAALFCVCAALSTLLAGRIAEAFVSGTGYLIDARTAVFSVSAVIAACLVGTLATIRFRWSFHTVVWLSLPVLLASVILLAGFYRRDGSWQAGFQPSMPWPILMNAFAVFLALVLFTAMALVLSLFFSPVSTVALCLAILAIGLLSDWMLLAAGTPSVLRGLTLALVPNWNHFWLGNYSDPLNAAPRSILLPGMYAAFQTGAVLVAGLFIFHHSEASR